MKHRMKQLLCALAVAIAAPAHAILIDSHGDTALLTGTVGGNAVVIGIDGTVLQGVGNSKTFLTVQGPGFERGYNTTGLTEFQTTPSGTTALGTAEIPTAQQGATQFLEFAYSLNQEGNDALNNISRILIFQTGNAALTGFNDGGTPNIGLQTNLIFAWSQALSGQTLTVEDFVSGQSNVEMLLLVRADNFNPALPNVVMYVEQTNGNDGPDKWVVFTRSACVDLSLCEPGTTDVPLPGSLALATLGLGVLGFVRRRKQA